MGNAWCVRVLVRVIDYCGFCVVIGLSFAIMYFVWRKFG